MTKLKVGDAVRTPSGSVARVAQEPDTNGVVALEEWELVAFELALHGHKLTRLVPEDESLAGRAQEEWE